MFSVPPRLMPGAASWLVNFTGTGDADGRAGRDTLESTWVGWSRSGSSWKPREMTWCFSPSTSTLNSVVRKCPA